MKLIINYDLVNQIQLANTGINLKRIATKMGMYFGIVTILDAPIIISGGSVNPASIALGATTGLIIYTGSEFALKNITMDIANSRLKEISSKLQKINVYTDLESLKRGKHYKTEYKLVKSGDRRVLEQDKYIMIPTVGYLNNDHVSLLQEHEIGSREYVLSMGEPKKVYQKSLSPFARYNA